MKGVKSYSWLYGDDSADQSSTDKGPPKYMKILISLATPLKCRIPASVGLWNEVLTNRLTVDEGSQKLFPVIWGRFCRPVVHGRGSTQNMKILISLVRPPKCRIPASVWLWNEGMTNTLTVDEGSQKLFPVIW